MSMPKPRDGCPHPQAFAVLALTVVGGVLIGCGPTAHQLAFPPMTVRAARPVVEAPPPPSKVIEIPDRVVFQRNRAKIVETSYKVLDHVVRVLKGNAAIKQIEIQGHTDAWGKARLNQRLSQARAEAVRTYLIEKGIKPERLVARGYGQTRPIESNKTADGRQKNRRVEFHIMRPETTQ